MGRTGTAAMLSPGGSCISSASCAVTANSSGGFISVTIHHCTRVHAAPSVGVTNCSYLPRATPTILNEISCAVTLAVLSGTKFTSSEVAQRLMSLHSGMFPEGRRIKMDG